MASAMEPMRTTVKLSLADETHRVTLDTAALSFDALRALVPSTFTVVAPPRDWTLVYTDNEGDLVTVASAAEFDEARRVLLALDAVATTGSSSSARTPTMHFRVVPTVSVADQLAPAVLHAVDELSHAIARLASDTRDSIAQCVYLERGRATVVHSASKTRELFDAARREVMQRLRVVQTRIAGEIERRRSSVDSEVSAEVQDDSSSAADVGDDGATRHSQHVLGTDAESGETHSDGDDDDSDDEPDAQAVTPGNEPQAVAGAADMDDPVAPRAAAAAPDESDAETAASDSDDDDDSDDEWAVVPAAWSTEVALVRSILPHVHVDDCVAMLRKHGGDLEAAINELTDA